MAHGEGVIKAQREQELLTGGLVKITAVPAGNWSANQWFKGRHDFWEISFLPSP
jgi:hypothetical protein